METTSIISPFFETGVFGYKAFERHGEVYRMNPTIVTVEKVLELLTEEEKAFLKAKKPSFFSLPNEKSVIVGIVDKVYDDPFLGLTATEEELPSKEAADEFNKMMTEMNGIEFHRQYYHLMTKEVYTAFVVLVTDGQTTDPDDLTTDDFFYTFNINFFGPHLVGNNEDTKTDKRAEFFKKVLEDMDQFDYVFLGEELPKDRIQMHCLVWEK